MRPQTPRTHRTGGRRFLVWISSELKVLKVHHLHGRVAARLVGRLLLHSEQLAVIAEVMSDTSQPDKPLVAWLLSADRVLDPERDVPSQCRPMPLAAAEAAADTCEKMADECDAAARAADLLGSMVPAQRDSAPRGANWATTTWTTSTVTRQMRLPDDDSMGYVGNDE